MRLSSILHKIDVIFHISFIWIKLGLHAKNQLPRLPGTALIVISPGVVVVVWWWCGVFF